MASNSAKSKLTSRLGGFRGVVAVVALLSAIVNVLGLTGAFYMLQIYDRVLASHSVPTLVALSLLALIMFSFQGFLDIIRGQLLIRLAASIDRRLIAPAYEVVLRLPLFGRSAAEAVNPIRDLDTIRGFVAGQSLVALIDLPWLPFYLAFVFLLHPWLGWLIVAGAIVLVGLTIATDRAVRDSGRTANELANRRLGLAEAHARNADVLKAMGLGGRAQDRYRAAHLAYVARTDVIAERSALLSGIAKVVRQVLQSAILGLGAYLTLRGEVSAGAIVAASIAGSRALAPVELAIANWRAFVAARHSHARLEQLFAALPGKEDRLELPTPKSTLTVEAITVPAPGHTRIIVSDVSFELSAGQGLAVIGPSASGKSTLARAISGVWPLARGTVRIDGANLEHWSEAALSHNVGFMPQDVELFEGTITDNIARFEPDPPSALVFAAAEAADIHKLVLRLPDGYETNVGPGGSNLSAGQRQRVALARALYRSPFLVILDEPNSNLDADGETALATAVRGIRARGGIVVVVAHRPGILAAVDRVAVMAGGRLAAFGPRDEVLNKALRATDAPRSAVSASA